MRELVLTSRFERSFRRLVRKAPSLQQHIETTLSLLSVDLSNPKLKTHHLSGPLSGYFACSCGYDCRIVFAKEKSKEQGKEVLILIDIGSHDEVY
ncbi:MAG TPA: type II toxin-antitoxin system YafQ family toxin [Verrucomicrobiae bacterium]|nr:type II toxin-antitoxin system YafQ family toxin [Verrucomicrobiae bacterium]